MRDPIHKIESARAQGYYQKWPSMVNVPFESIPQSLLDGARYASIIEQYLKRFSSQDLLLLRLEDLNRDPRKTVQKAVEFLSLNSFEQFRGLQKIHNARNRYRKDTVWHKLSSVGLLKQFSGRLPESWKNHLRQWLSTPTFSQDVVEVPGLTTFQKHEILIQLQPELTRLAQEYHVALTGWQVKL
ncbi:MAG: hypothetical protein F6K42_17585 [Leptolyngbya sp. SIO1D8]|nr:hypothetical protein [Leptolyngbya sp. SIO1D8]